MSKVLGSSLCAAVLVLSSNATSSEARAPVRAQAPTVTHGVIVGDVSASSALLWARADQEATLSVVLSGGRHRKIEAARARTADDYTVRVPLEGLAPGTRYKYRAWFSLGAPGVSRGPTVEGSFQTAPAEDQAAPVRLAFGGDLAGQNVCRHAAEGFPIMDTVRARRPDLFVGLGDMIYADNACSAVGLYGNAQMPGGFGPAVDLASFWALALRTRRRPVAALAFGHRLHRRLGRP
jgi:alkaline phosphatase D